MRTPDETKEIVRTFVDEVFNKRNLKYAEENLAAVVVEHNPLSPDMGNDRAAALATMQAILELSPDMTVRIDEMIATGDRAAMRAVFSGTDSAGGWGAPMGAPATGKAFSVGGIDVAVLDDEGKLIEHYGIFDVPAMLVQLGLMPAPGTA